MPEEIIVPSLSIKDFEGDELSISLLNDKNNAFFWIDTSSPSLVFTNKEELRKLANFILENI